MKKITVHASRNYDIFIENGMLQNCADYLLRAVPAKSFAVITDDIVDKLYADTVINALSDAGFSVCKFVFKNGEASKSLSVLNDIYNFLCENNITRSDCLIALGGGVVGDITGFAAATYLRGLDYVQIPTTLLAQIDSSVGGKTAVNLECGKNLAGSFKQPSCVICDPLTLKTLSPEILADGMAEAIKYGMIRDEELFEIIESHTLGNVGECISDIIFECVSIKKSVVEADEFDKGERMILNFGHTLGHAIEKFYDYKTYSHGSAVAAGMCMITEIAVRHNLCERNVLDRLVKCVLSYKLPTNVDADLCELVKLCSNDKKRESSKLNFIICDKIGHSVIKNLPVNDFYSFICQ